GGHGRPGAASISRIPNTGADARSCSAEAFIDRGEERLVAGVLPARSHIVGDIGESNAGYRIAKAERAPRAEMAEGFDVGPERPLGLRQLKTEAETALAVENAIRTEGLFLRGGREHGLRDDVDTVEAA